MSGLEDRIKNTGEHFLGTFDPTPDLQERIAERVELRARQRRQRAATGLGAGVVVVLGGLVVLNVRAESGPGASASAPNTRPAIESFLTSTTVAVVGSIVATAAPQVATTFSRPQHTSAPAPTTSSAPSTVVPPMSPDAPTLFTDDGGAGTGMMRSIDLSSGVAADAPLALPEEISSRRTTSASGLRYDLRPAAEAGMPCGGPGLVVTNGGTDTATALPTEVTDFELSDDGRVGLLAYPDCPAGATAPVGMLHGRFDPDHPEQGVTPIDLPDLGELNADGHYLAVGTDASFGVVDLHTGADVALPPGCGSVRPDPSTGYFVGPDEFAALGVCDGATSLLGGPIEAITIVRQLPGCSQNAALKVRTTDAPSADWFAVLDVDRRQAWVVGPDAVSEAFDVGDKIWWTEAADSGS